MENENRSIFALDGITGMLIATVLLLSILVVLTIWNINVQAAEATNYYEIENASELKFKDSDNADHYKLK